MLSYFHFLCSIQVRSKNFWNSFVAQKKSEMVTRTVFEIYTYRVPCFQMARLLSYCIWPDLWFVNVNGSYVYRGRQFNATTGKGLSASAPFPAGLMLVTVQISSGDSWCSVLMIWLQNETYLIYCSHLQEGGSKRSISDPSSRQKWIYCAVRTGTDSRNPRPYVSQVLYRILCTSSLPSFRVEFDGQSGEGVPRPSIA